MLRVLLVVVLAVAAASPAAAETPVERVPSDLAGDVALLGDALSVLDGNASSTSALADARHAYAAVAPFAADLDAGAGELLTNYWTSLEAEATAGNATNVASLARAAAGLCRGTLADAAEAWARHRTAVTIGAPSEGDDGLVLPILLLNPPPGGIGAFDVRLHVDPDVARPLSAAPAMGDGEATVEAGNGTARVASFDARALLAVGSSASGVVVLAHVTLDVATAATTTVTVEVVDLVDRDGEPVPVVSPDAEVALVPADGGLPRWVPLVAVGALGVGAVLAARRWLAV